MTQQQEDLSVKPQAGDVVKINRRAALVTKVEPFRVYFRYQTARGWSGTERNIYWDEAGK